MLARCEGKFGEGGWERDGNEEEVCDWVVFERCEGGGLFDVSLKDKETVDGRCFEDIDAEVGDVEV